MYDCWKDRQRKPDMARLPDAGTRRPMDRGTGSNHHEVIVAWVVEGTGVG